MMQEASATDETLEGLALGLLGRYEREFGALAAPPVPVERIVENVLDLGILWEPIDEGPDEHILAELVPESRTVVFNERRHLLIEQTPGLYNTILGHEAGTGRRTSTAGPRNKCRFRAWSKASAACSAGLGTDRAGARPRRTGSWVAFSCRRRSYLTQHAASTSTGGLPCTSCGTCFRSPYPLSAFDCSSWASCTSRTTGVCSARAWSTWASCV